MTLNHSKSHDFALTFSCTIKSSMVLLPSAKQTNLNILILPHYVHILLVQSSSSLYVIRIKSLAICFFRHISYPSYCHIIPLHLPPRHASSIATFKKADVLNRPIPAPSMRLLLTHLQSFSLVLCLHILIVLNTVY